MIRSALGDADTLARHGISSQHPVNWLRHGVVAPEAVEEALRRVAALARRPATPVAKLR